MNKRVLVLLVMLVSLIVLISYYVYSEISLSPDVTLEKGITNTIDSSNPEPISKIRKDETRYFSDKIIVKYSREASSNLANSAYKSTGVLEIDNLNKDLNAEIEPLFKFLHDNGKTIPAKEWFDKTKIKYSQRQERSPSDRQLPDLENVYLVRVKPGTNIQEIISAYRANPNVLWAQPDYELTTYSVPNDPYYLSSGSWGQPYSDLWGLKPDKIDAENAWDVSQGQGIVVAVVDTGVSYSHNDISSNIWINSGEDINGNGLIDSSDFDGIDNDNNGYVDDLRGWDFYNTDNDPLDDHGHGTHVSGTIAAIGNNEIGIIGVAPQAKIMPVKGLDASGSGDSAKLASAIVYAASNGADIISNSWGCTSACPNNPLIEEAVSTAYNLGAVIVFAAGNSKKDTISYSPQNMVNPKPIVVVASTETDVPAYFSNYGYLVDVSAPGGGTNSPPPSSDPSRNILSLKSQTCSSSMCPSNLIVGTYYLRQAGTSMAAPAVSGAAALILANNPTLTNENVRQILRVSSDDFGVSGFDPDMGAGRIDIANALQITSVPQVKITSPLAGSSLVVLDDSIEIIGTAGGQDFQTYQLSFKQIDNLNNPWVEIYQSTTPVNNGILGIWQFSDLPTGTYALRVVVTTSSGYLFEDFSVVYLDSFNIQQITGDYNYNYYPSIWENKVVWKEYDYATAYEDIYLYDLDTQTEQRITTNKGDLLTRPKFNSDKIVWQDARNGNYDIYLYDLDTQTEQRITTNPVGQHHPDVWGNKVVWQDYRNSNYDIYLYDLDTQTEQRITNNDYHQILPRIWENKIVWVDYRNEPSGGIDGNADIYLYDLDTQTEQRITTDPGFQYWPDIWEDKIVWWDERNSDPGNDNDAVTYLYDLDTQTEQRLTAEGPAYQVYPSIWGNKIVWQDHRNNNYDIYLYDLDTQTEQRLTARPDLDGFPEIFGDKVVWQRTGGGGVYFINLNRPPKLSPIGNKSIRQGKGITFTVTASDLDNNLINLAASPLPVGAVFRDNGDNTGTFNWVPNYNQIGSFQILFAANDGEFSDSEMVTITVTANNANQLPRYPNPPEPVI